MSDLNLTKFCATDELRPYLMVPFSRGDYTYATNGHIMVRVPRRADVPDGAEPIKNVEGPLSDMETAAFVEPDFSAVPAPAIGEDADDCEWCDGTGRAHEDCSCCTHKCEKCGGTAKLDPTEAHSAEVGGAPFNVRYLRMVAGLSPTAIAVVRPKENPVLYARFDGGICALMGLRGPSGTHHTASRSEAAE